MANNYKFYTEKIDLNDAFIIHPFVSEDNRGKFVKIYEKDIFAELSISAEINEIFQTVSQKNVIRGMHFQTGNPQIKLVSVICGEILDVIVDLRPDSSTFKKYIKTNISDQNKKILYVPKGFAHGFLVLSEMAVVNYVCLGKYNKETDTGIRFDDPVINIQWPIGADEVIISKRDQVLQSFNEFQNKALSWINK